jgi:hypothetical protein
MRKMGSLAVNMRAESKRMRASSVSKTKRKPLSNTAKGRPVPRSVYAAFLVLTAAYLLVEVPFAADLLDVLSATPDHDAIDAVEHTGRLISGAALALALVGILVPAAIKRRWPVMKTMAWSAVVCAGSVYGIYHGEKNLINTIAESMSAEFRQGAAFAALAKEEILSGAGIQGYALDKNDPASMVFTAFIPAAARADSVIFDSFNRSAKAALASSSMTDNVLSMADFKSDVLAKAFDEVEMRRRSLIAQQSSYGTRNSDAVAFAEKNWARASGVIQARIDHRAFDGGFRQVFINNERGRGIPLKGDFFTNRDLGRVYKKAAINSYFNNIEARYRQSTGNRIPAEMKWPTETTKEFYSIPAIQRDVKKSLGVIGFDGTIAPGMSAATERSLYLAVRADATEDFKSRFFQKAAFSDHGALKEAGIDAARMAIVPIFAIGLSLLGAFVHICKLTNFGILLFSPSMSRMPMVRVAVSLLVGTGTAGLMYQVPTEVTTQPYVSKASDLMVRDMGKPAEFVMYASMSVQRAFYPMAKAMAVVSPLKLYEQSDVRMADISVEDVVGFVGKAVAEEKPEVEKSAPKRIPTPTFAIRG